MVRSKHGRLFLLNGVHELRSPNFLTTLSSERFCGQSLFLRINVVFMDQFHRLIFLLQIALHMSFLLLL